MSVTALPLRVARAGWGSYNQSLQKHPLLTKTITAAVGFSIGDAVAQLSTEPMRNYNLTRTLRMGAFGLLFAGPLQGHVWFNLLDKVRGVQQSYSDTCLVYTATSTVWSPPCVTGNLLLLQY